MNINRNGNLICPKSCPDNSGKTNVSTTLYLVVEFLILKNIVYY